jgi:hypothetical protein
MLTNINDKIAELNKKVNSFSSYNSKINSSSNFSKIYNIYYNKTIFCK